MTDPQQSQSFFQSAWDARRILERSPETPSPATAARETREAPESPSQYAAEAAEAHENLPDDKKSWWSEVIAFASQGVKDLVHTFNESTPIKKFAMGTVAAGVTLGTLYLGGKALKRAAEALTDSVSSLLGTSERLQDQGEAIREESHGSLLKILIPILGIGLIALLWPYLRAVHRVGKAFEWSELLDAAGSYTGKGGAAVGGLLYLAEKMKEGDLDLPKSLWDQIAERVDGIPTWDEIQTSVDGAGERVSEQSEQVRERLGWFKEKFTDPAYSNLAEALGTEFPGWENEPTMSPILLLRDAPEKILEFLELDLNNDREFEAWEAASVGGGIAAGWLLIQRLLGTRWANLGLRNAAFYVILRRQGMEEHVVHGIQELQELKTRVSAEIDEKITLLCETFGIPRLWILDAKEFTFDLGIDLMLDAAEQNPKISAMVAMNAAWYMSGVLFAVTSRILSFLATKGWDVLMDHLTFAATLGAYVISSGTVLTIKRKEFLTDVSKKLYSDPAEQKKFLELFDIDPEKPDTTLEKLADPFYERLIKDPLSMLEDPHLKVRLFHEIGEGKIVWRIDGGLGVVLGIVTGLNPVWHLANFEVGVLEDLLLEFSKSAGPDQELDVGAVTGLGAQAFFIGKGLKGAVQGYRSLNLLTNNPHRGITVFFKSVLPFSKESKHVFWAIVREYGNFIEGAELVTILQGRQISRFSDLANELIKAAEKVPPDVERVRKLNAILDDVFIRLKSGHFLYLEDESMIDSLRRAKESCGYINETLGKAHEPSMPPGEKAGFMTQAKSHLSALKGHLTSVRTTYSEFFNITRLIGHGNFKGAIESSARIMREYRAGGLSSPLVLPHIAPAEAAELRRLGVTDRSLRRLERLVPSQAELQSLITELQSDPSKIAKVEKVFASNRYPHYEKVLLHAKTSGTMRTLGVLSVLMIVYAYDQAPSKTDFLLKSVPEFGGAALGVEGARRGVLFAERTVGKAIPHKGVRVVIDLLAGLAGFALGGSFFDQYLTKPLDRAFPNRHVAGSGLGEDVGSATLGAVFDIVEHIGEGMGIGEGVSEHTNPLDYLTDSVRYFRPFGKDSLSESARSGSMMEEHRVHTKEELTENAEQALVKGREKLAELRTEIDALPPDDSNVAKLQEEIDQQVEALQYIETLADGSWVQNLQQMLLYQKMIVELYRPEFMRLAEEKFGERGATFVSTYVSRLYAPPGAQLVDKEDRDIWEYMVRSAKVELDDEEMTFYDFTRIATLNSIQIEQMKSLGYSPFPPEPSEDADPDVRQEEAIS